MYVCCCSDTHGLFLHSSAIYRKFSANRKYMSKWSESFPERRRLLRQHLEQTLENSTSLLIESAESYILVLHKVCLPVCPKRPKYGIWWPSNFNTPGNTTQLSVDLEGWAINCSCCVAVGNWPQKPHLVLTRWSTLEHYVSTVLYCEVLGVYYFCPPVLKDLCYTSTSCHGALPSDIHSHSL